MMTPQYIKNRFGSRRGLINTFLYTLKCKLGGYRAYQNIQLEQIKRLVFICSGNICRSPLAEYAAKKNGANTVSFGLHCRGGDAADSRAINYGSKVNIDLSSHITQNIQLYKPQAGDLLIAMEPKQAQELEVLFGNSVPITLVGLWLSKKQPYIHDPYSASPIFFEFCEAQVVSAVESLVKKLSPRE